MIGMVWVYDDKNPWKWWKPKYKKFLPLDERLMWMLEEIDIPITEEQEDRIYKIILDNTKQKWLQQ